MPSLYQKAVGVTAALAIALPFWAAYSTAAPLPMDWRKPTPKDIAEGRWKIKPISTGGHKGIIRVRVKEQNPGDQYELRVTVRNVGSGEESMVDTPALTTELETQ